MLPSPRPVEVDLTDPVAADGVDLPVGGGHGGGGAGELHGRDLLPLVGVETVPLARLQTLYYSCITLYYSTVLLSTLQSPPSASL